MMIDLFTLAPHSCNWLYSFADCSKKIILRGCWNFLQRSGI